MTTSESADPHPLHAYIARLIADRLKERHIVVIYDKNEELRPFFAELTSEPATEALVPVRVGYRTPKLCIYDGSFLKVRFLVEPVTSGEVPEDTLIYIPGRERDETGSLLMELEKGGDLYRPPALKRLVREVLAAEETRRETNLGLALQFLNKVQKRRAVVFLISDFMTNGYEKELRVMARHHDLIACPISDPREQNLTNIGLSEVADPETGKFMLVDTSSRRLLESFRSQAADEEQARDKQFLRLKVDRLALTTDRPFVDDVRRLFHLRQHRRQRG